MPRPSLRRLSDETPRSRVEPVSDGPAREQRLGHHIGQPAPDRPPGPQPDRRTCPRPRRLLADAVGAVRSGEEHGRTLGIDLAAQPKGTASCEIDWATGEVACALHVDDPMLTIQARSVLAGGGI